MRMIGWIMAIPTFPAGIARSPAHVMHFIHHCFRAARHAPRFSIEHDNFRSENVNGTLTMALSGTGSSVKG